MASWRKEKKKVKKKRMYFKLRGKGKKGRAWMDFELFQKERAWMQERELKYARDYMAGLLPFQCGVPPDNRNYPLTNFIMANIITKDKATRESVDRHMRNSIEYENPNLKDKVKADFPVYDGSDKERLRNQRDLQGLLNVTFNGIKPRVGGWRVDENYRGFFTYSIEGIAFDPNEVKVEFESMAQCINKLNQITNDYVPIGHI